MLWLPYYTAAYSSMPVVCMGVPQCARMRSLHLLLIFWTDNIIDEAIKRKEKFSVYKLNVVTSNTRVIQQTFNGFQKVYGWCSLVEGFGECATHRLGKTVLHTCFDLFKPGKNFSHLSPPVHTCSHLLTPVHTCSQLFTPFHTCSHLLTPQWLSTLFVQWQFFVEFSPCKSCSFSNLRATLLKLHIFAHLIENYPTVSGLSICIE